MIKTAAESVIGPIISQFSTATTRRYLEYLDWCQAASFPAMRTGSPWGTQEAIQSPSGDHGTLATSADERMPTSMGTKETLHICVILAASVGSMHQ
jgi:hypothetical protein